MKKKIIILVTLFTVLFSILNFGNSTVYAAEFDDTSGHWANEEIKRATDAGYIKGYPDSTFKPDKTVTRAEYITMLNSAFNVPMEGTSSKYTDVKRGDWFAKEVWAAVKAGYADIFTGNSFKPNQPLKRQEAATLTANLSGVISSENDKGFTDHNQIDAWARKKVAAMATAGIISGYLDGSFRPGGDITRAEAVAIINRAIIYADSTKLDALITVTGSVVNIRSGPDTSYNVVTQANRGRVLTASLQSSNNWYRVSVGDSSGWIIGDYAAIYELPDIKPGDEPGGDRDNNGGNPSRGDDVDRGGSDDDRTGKRLVVVDAGHGGHDSGAVGLNGTLEKDINLAIALSLTQYLIEDGYDVLMTRSDDTFIPLIERSRMSNEAKADIFVSIHCNASVNHDAFGTSVYTQSDSPPGLYPNQEDSKRLAAFVQEELLEALGLKNAGIRQKNLSVCRETNAPTVLVETAFLDNIVEEMLLNIPEFRDQAAMAIKKGIDNYFAN